MKHRIVLLLTALLLTIANAMPVLAVPANNNWANREVIAALPFADNEPDVSTATVEATDPQLICRVGTSGVQGGNSVWYSYTTGASAEFLNLSTATSTYDTIVSVYTGSAGSFSLVAGGCNDDGIAAVFQSRINGLRLAPNTAYSIEVSAFTTAAGGTILNFALGAAPQYAVTKTADTNDGVCDADCSLREAVGVSNATPGAIIVPAGNYMLTLAGAGENNNATGDLDVRSGMSLYGAGPGSTQIDANDLDRVLEVDPPTASNRVTFILSGITLTNGTTTSDGGALLLAANSDFLAIENCVISNSISSIINGGGLRSASRGTLWNSVVSGNSASSNGGGISLSGGLDTTFEVRGSTISGNQSLSSSSTGGGGIHSTARLRVINSTISGNSARFSGGGVIATGSGSIVVSSSTIVNNTADADSNGSGTGGGIRLESSSLGSAISNSVIANNTDNNPVPATDCSRSAGTIASSFNHVEAIGTCAFLVGSGDVTGTDPLLDAALGNNGGVSLTHAIQTGSPLIDAGNPAGCTDYLNAALAFDQRGAGFARSVDGNGDMTAVCDKGAVEFLPTLIASPGTPDLAPASDSGQSNTDNNTQVALATFTGSCPLDGTTIALRVDGSPVAPTTLCNAGAYSITLGASAAEGTRAITATASDMINTSAPSAPLQVIFDFTTPAMLTITGPTPPVAPAVTFTGSGAEFNGIEIQLLDGAVPLCIGTASSAPAWTCSTTLSPGTYSPTAVQIDVAGHVSPPSTAFTFTISDQLFADGFE